jgi:hypothetical protein
MLYNTDKSLLYPICNYYYDKTEVDRSISEIDYAAPPLLFQQKFWGKYIQLSIPSPFGLVNDYSTLTNSTTQPRLGGIQSNLVYPNDQLSLSSPIFIDFQFLTNTETKLLQKYYYVGDTFSCTLPITPEFETLAVKIQHHQDDDYFQIFGVFNNNSADFSTFLNRSILEGRRYYVIYQIDTFEKNIRTNTQQFFLNDNFDVPQDFRPIIKYSTTTAILDVTMKLVDVNSNSEITRTSSYVMLQDEVAKYAKKLTKINIDNSYKPKIYNAKPDILITNNTSSINTNTTPNKIPYAVMYERFNVVTKNISNQINDTVWRGVGLQEILLQPNDNIFKFVVATGTDTLGYIPYIFDTKFNVYLMFRSDKTTIEIPLYYGSGINSDGSVNDIDLNNGVVIFKVLETQIPILKNIYNDGFNQFYIINKNELGSTTIYFGFFRLFNSIN